MAVKAKKKGWSVEVDFEGVESGGFTLDDGTYQAEIVKAESTESSEGNPMLVLGWVVTEGKKKGTKLNFDNVSLMPQALWKLKGLLEALEVEVPDGALEIEESDLVGGQCGIEVTNETYEGKKRPKITGYVSGGEGGESSDGDDDDDDDDDKKVAKKPAKKADKAKDDDDADDEDDDGDKKVGKKPSKTAKFKEGQRVKFRDDKDKLVKGKVVEIEGDTAKVEDAEGDTWELEVSDLEAV